jgi:peroxiredoxin
MDGAAMNEPLPAGTEAPDFTLKDSNGFNVSLTDYRGSPVLLAFYPLDWSPGCSQQLDLYQHEMLEFEKRGVKVVGISVDSIYSHGAWAKVRGIHFPLLSDFNPKGEVARKYNVYRDSDGFSERALYLIDGEKTIRYSIVSPQINHIPDIYSLFSKLDEVYKPVITL